MPNEPVPVKTMYPDPPPAAEAQWVHLDWIQSTAAKLAIDWVGHLEQRDRWRQMRDAGLDQPDPQMRHDLARLQRLRDEILPLFDEAKKYLPPEELIACKYITRPHDAEHHPAEAAEEWRVMGLYAEIRRTKLNLPAHVPASIAPTTNKKEARRLAIRNRYPELASQCNNRESLVQQLMKEMDQSRSTIMEDLRQLRNSKAIPL